MNIKEKQKFYVFDYFLDGHFLNSEAGLVEHFPQSGEVKLIQTKNGINTSTKILGTEKISENEYRIFLASLI